MNYGTTVQFGSRNGRSGIFWQQDLAKKSDRKFGYKNRQQRFSVRRNPQNFDPIPPEQLNYLHPQTASNSEILAEKPKLPVKNFIKRNREKVGGKLQEKKEEKTVTLTQDQLNAILASVGKVATGKENALRISIDSGNNEITIESPRKHEQESDDEEIEEKADKEKSEKDESSKEDRQKRKSKKDRRKQNEEESIYSILSESRGTTRERSTHGERKKVKNHARRNRRYSDEESEEDEPVRDRRKNRNDSREREISQTRRQTRLDSRERDSQHDHDKRKSKKVHEKRRRKKEEESEDDDEPTPRSDHKTKSVKTPDKKTKSSREKQAKSPATPENKADTSPERKQLTPRDIVGIPAALPWKHMTVAERRRLMLARISLAEGEKKEKEEPPEQSRQNTTETRTRRPVREVSPEPPRHTEVVSHAESSSPPQGLPPVPRGHMSLAEKKRMQWEKERSESVADKDFSPWGRPGAGAPVRTRSGHVLADYRSRQDFFMKHSMEEISEDQAEESKVSKSEKPVTQNTDKQKKVPTTESSPPQNQHAAMRSSFVIGQIAPDPVLNENAAMAEKRMWREELDRQREENQLRKIRELQEDLTSENTWADKLSNDYKPRNLPEQQHVDDVGALDSGRISSAPTKFLEATEQHESFIRGQNAYIDPAVKKDLEEKRKRHLEHQSAIMAQVQEKQRQKQLELDQKRKEDMEEEKRLQKERDLLQNQFQTEQQKLKQKEYQRQLQIEKLKMAMDDAHEKAMQEKMIRRLEHLQQGGHDTSQLRANLEDRQIQTSRSKYVSSRLDTYKEEALIAAHLAKFATTPRNVVTNVEPAVVPGLDLDLSPRQPVSQFRPQYTHTDRYTDTQPQYTENRVLTPSNYRHRIKATWEDPSLHARDFSTQTGMAETEKNEKTVSDPFDPSLETRGIPLGKETSDTGILYKDTRKVRVKSAAPVETERPTNRQSKKKATSRKGGKNLWNYQNPKHKKPVKQSEKDPFYDRKRYESESRRTHRENELLALVEANRAIIPTERYTPSHSRDPSPASERGHTTKRNHTGRRSKSHSPSGVDSHHDHFSHRQHNDSSVNSTSRSRQRTVHSNRTKSPPAQRVLSPVQSARTLEKYPAKSPIVPALRHKLNEGHVDQYLTSEQNPDYYSHDDYKRRNKNVKYSDVGPVDAPVPEGDFIPFLRSAETLDPAHAEEPLPVSRETSAVTRARKAYLHGLEPSSFGGKVDVYEDSQRMPVGTRKKDPILNPSMVKDHPTQRQDIILQQLSTLKQSLMQRQRELETFSPSDLE